MRRVRRAWLVSALCAAPLAAQQPAAPAAATAAAASPYAVLTGVVVDSIHGGPLQGAIVTVTGTERHGTTDTHSWGSPSTSVTARRTQPFCKPRRRERPWPREWP